MYCILVQLIIQLFETDFLLFEVNILTLSNQFANLKAHAILLTKEKEK